MGFVGEKTEKLNGTDLINCHVSKEIGEKIMAQFVGKKFGDIKMKRSDNVRSLATVNSSVKVNEKVININPLILYQRMLIRRNMSDDLSDYFKYEIAPYPLSLFTNSGMKNIKSNLYEEFTYVDEDVLK